MELRWAVGVLVVAAGCRDRPRALPLAQRDASKRTVYGDASLVPTREGERARREVAWAAEIEAAVAVLGGVEDVHAVVELGTGSGPLRGSVVCRLEPGSAQAVVLENVEALTRSILGASAVTTVIVEVASTAPPRPQPGLPLPLGLALLGMGASVGITVDRVVRRRQLARRRARSRGG